MRGTAEGTRARPTDGCGGRAVVWPPLGPRRGVGPRASAERSGCRPLPPQREGGCRSASADPAPGGRPQAGGAGVGSRPCAPPPRTPVPARPAPESRRKSRSSPSRRLETSSRERGLCDMRGFTQTPGSVGGVGAARNRGSYEVLGTSPARRTDLETAGTWQAHISPVISFLFLFFRGWLASVGLKISWCACFGSFAFQAASALWGPWVRTVVRTEGFQWKPHGG